MWFMMFGTTSGTCTRTSRYHLFNRVTSSSFREITVNLRAMKGGGIAAFIFNILAGLSGQLRAPAALATGKYSPVGLAVE
jgi:hypothetical protein